MISRPAVFLDRDGVINRKMPEGDYVKSWNEFSFLPDTFEALRIFKRNAFLVILTTNQRCIAKGIITEDQLNKIHNMMIEEVRRNNVDVDAIYFCPHDVYDDCICRKPKTGLISKAIDEFKKQGIEINIGNSYMIGDSESDILAGKNAGLRTIKIGDYSKMADNTVDSLLEAAKQCL